MAAGTRARGSTNRKRDPSTRELLALARRLRQGGVGARVVDMGDGRAVVSVPTLELAHAAAPCAVRLERGAEALDAELAIVAPGAEASAALETARRSGFGCVALALPSSARVPEGWADTGARLRLDWNRKTRLLLVLRARPAPDELAPSGVKPGEPRGNLAARAAWFQKRRGGR
jgi:hypothetical protein